MSAADRIYPALLRAYPRAWAAAHGNELLATLAFSSQGRVLPREVTGLLLGGFHQRRLEDRSRPRAATFDSAACLAALLLLGVSLMSSIAIALDPVMLGAGLPPWTFPLATLLSLSKFALLLRGHPGAALLLAPFSYPLLLATASPIILLIWLDTPAVAGLAWLALRRRPAPTVSWGWMLVPLMLGAAMLLPFPLFGIAIGITLATTLLVAACEVRFALAAVPVCFVLAGYWTVTYFTLGTSSVSQSLLHPAMGLAVVGLAFLLRSAGNVSPRSSTTPR
ncbi:hypothetical protein GCM10022223_33760 [Kineosporia mesophila]|uniref:Uncharacterized protein n=1 Tax=Kineosporia mesophila TaxID=566012 RepID=A0ABP6ZMW2_9ACTN|nr:hypothetical protein [Kineosporia mesophila]MCD5354753.1 hypothetical protein [Kineosporia mesophila]